MSSQPKTRAKKSVHTYVLDTSVLLADPGAMRRFAEHEVVLPVVVITELEGKRHHPELGFFARAALRSLDELRVIHGRLDEPVPVGEEGGTLRVELNHTDPTSLPVGLPARGQRHPDPRRRLQPRPGGRRRSRWSPRTCRCGSRRPPSGWTPRSTAPRPSATPTPATPGMAELEVAAGELDELYDDGTLDLDAARDLPCHQGLVLLSDRGTALGRVGPGQAGAPGPRRPGGVRHPRPLRRAADRAGDAARPRGRHRLPRWPGRHRQVGDGAVRRPRGRDGAPPAQEGRGLPAALRRRRPGARLPARLGVGEDVALGPGGLRHPRLDDLARR